MAVHSSIDPSDYPSVLKTLEQHSAKLTTSVANAAGQTHTAAAYFGGLILRSGAAGVSDTTPTAAQLVAAFPGIAAGDTRMLEIRNNNTGTLTIVAGTGVTLEGTTTIPTVNTRRYAIRFTNVTPGSEAVTLSGIAVSAL